MRISEGGQHTSEICRNILHNKGKRHIFFFARSMQNEIPKGQKREQSHVVRDKHGAYECHVNQDENAELCGSELSYYGFSKRIEKADIFKSAHHGENAEKAGERFKIKIGKILLVRRHDNRRNQGGKRGYKHYRVGLNEWQNSLHKNLKR